MCSCSLNPIPTAHHLFQIKAIIGRRHRLPIKVIFCYLGCNLPAEKWIDLLVLLLCSYSSDPHFIFVFLNPTGMKGIKSLITGDPAWLARLVYHINKTEQSFFDRSAPSALIPTFSPGLVITSNVIYFLPPFLQSQSNLNPSSLCAI